MMDKQLLREQVRAIRNGLSESERLLRSQQIQEKILMMDEYAIASRIGVYAACRGEVTLDFVVEQVLRDKKTVFFPRVLNSKEGLMEFYPVNTLDDLEEGSWGILEPRPSISAETIDLLLVPGVAFDHKGFRLGYGGGFYDRYLSRNRKKIGSCVGVSYECQLVEDVYPDRYDVRMDQVITEGREYHG